MSTLFLIISLALAGLGGLLMVWRSFVAGDEDSQLQDWTFGLVALLFALYLVLLAGLVGE